jgi:hypothetical protein
LACNSSDSSVDFYAGSEWIAFSIQLTSAVADVLIHVNGYVFINARTARIERLQGVDWVVTARLVSELVT